MRARNNNNERAFAPGEVCARNNKSFIMNVPLPQVKCVLGIIVLHNERAFAPGEVRARNIGLLAWVVSVNWNDYYHLGCLWYSIPCKDPPKLLEEINLTKTVETQFLVQVMAFTCRWSCFGVHLRKK